ncbi:MAG: tetratricopeptide (TPR) repeat protein [Arenicella sp.]|jgi:tetratricopeptide (TPR) repeat protein
MVATRFTFRLTFFARLTRGFGTLALGLLLLVILAGCASTPAIDTDDKVISSILSYQASLPENHPDSIERIFKLPDNVRQTIREKFNSSDRHRSARELAQWLMDPNGHNLSYDISANLTPAQAFEQRRGNCLSFTLLLVELAAELEINLRVNKVDLPDMWGQDSQDDLIFYRHVNAVFKTVHSTQIFDLAMEEYKQGFPQRLISKREAAALLFSNIGIEHLKKNNVDNAIHYLSLSASVYPSNPDMWINLAAAYKHIGMLDFAEKLYLQAFAINDKNSLAASNLERLYSQQGRKVVAQRFQKLAARARKRNPYLHYQNAEDAYKAKDYRSASKSIKKAIHLHAEDPDFYELSSRIKQVINKHVAAIKDLEKAHNLSATIEERGRYANKVKMVIARVKELLEQNPNQGIRSNSASRVDIYRGGYD